MALAVAGTADLRRLTFFVELARDLHFGRSAARQHVSQPTLSQQIKRLERELGVELFHRSGGTVVLTPAGEALLPAAVALLKHAARFNAAAAALAPRTSAPDVGDGRSPRRSRAARAGR